MALTLTETKVYSRYSSKNFFQLVWDNLDESDAAPNVANLTSNLGMRAKFAGNFGTGGHATLQGSMDGTVWADLKDSGGSTIDVTGAGEVLVGTGQVFRYLRPKVTAGTGVDIDVTLLVIP